MSPKQYGSRLTVRRWTPEGVLQAEHSTLAPGAVDVLCINDEGANLVGSPTAGCDWVNLDVQAFTRGEAPRVKKMVASTIALGCVHWDEGTRAAGKQVWVRIFGLHMYALVNSGLGVAMPGIIVPSSTAGQAAPVLEASATAGNWAQRLGHMLESHGGGGAEVRQVFIENPLRFPY